MLLNIEQQIGKNFGTHTQEEQGSWKHRRRTMLRALHFATGCLARSKLFAEGQKKCVRENDEEITSHVLSRPLSNLLFSRRNLAARPRVALTEFAFTLKRNVQERIRSRKTAGVDDHPLAIGASRKSDPTQIPLPRSQRAFFI